MLSYVAMKDYEPLDKIINYCKKSANFISKWEILYYDYCFDLYHNKNIDELKSTLGGILYEDLLKCIYEYIVESSGLLIKIEKLDENNLQSILYIKSLDPFIDFYFSCKYDINMTMCDIESLSDNSIFIDKIFNKFNKKINYLDVFNTRIKYLYDLDNFIPGHYKKQTTPYVSNGKVTYVLPNVIIYFKNKKILDMICQLLKIILIVIKNNNK